MTDGIGFLTPDLDGSATDVCRRLTLPSFLWPYVNGALGELLVEDNWTEWGNMTPDEVVQIFQSAIDDMDACP